MAMESPMISQKCLPLWMFFKIKKEVSWRLFGGSSNLKDKYTKSSRVCLLKQSVQITVESLVNISE